MFFEAMDLYRTLDLKFNQMDSSHLENNFKQTINFPTTRANMNEPSKGDLQALPFWFRLSRRLQYKSRNNWRCRDTDTECAAILTFSIYWCVDSGATDSIVDWDMIYISQTLANFAWCDLIQGWVGNLFTIACRINCAML